MKRLCQPSSTRISKTETPFHAQRTVFSWTADIRTLAPDWRPLQSTVKTRTVFSSFDLLAPWYENYAGDDGGEPLIGLARRGGRLVGVAPFVVCSGCLGKIPLTRVQFATPSSAPFGALRIVSNSFRPIRRWGGNTQWKNHLDY